MARITEWAVKRLTTSPKISNQTKRDNLQLYLSQNDKNVG